MAIKAGDKLPDVAFKVMTDHGPGDRSTNDIFGGKTVVLVAVPAAFSPTCHNSHIPEYLDAMDELHSKGVDEVVCVSVNDVFVMDAWARAIGAKDKIMFLADGSAFFAKAVGMDVDASAFGMGIRSHRYSMLVRDGIVANINQETKSGSTELAGVSAMLLQL